MFDVEHFLDSIQRLTSKYTNEKVEPPKLAPSVSKAGTAVVKALEQAKKSAVAYNKFEDGLDKTMAGLKKAVVDLQKWATDMLKDPRMLHDWPKLSKAVDAAIKTVPNGNEDDLEKQSASACKEVVAAIESLISATEQLSASIAKETFGVKSKDKSDDGLDKVKKLWTLNLERLLKVSKHDLKVAEQALTEIKKGMSVDLSRVNAVAA